MTTTAEKAKSLFEDRRGYHDEARRTLPVLVRQAQAGETIEYGVIADEVGVNGARNMGYPLGCVGKTLLQLGERWGTKIPPIETIVVNKEDGLPGIGVAHFLPNPRAFSRATTREKRIIVRSVLQEVFEYRHWDRVLKSLGLEAIPRVELPGPRPRGSGGEGPEHLALKNWIADNPDAVGAAGMAPEVEQYLSSADVVDVVFRGPQRVLAVEVKGVSSSPEDQVRGIFQAVKYRAVLEAEAKVEGVRTEVDAVLVLGGNLPDDVRGIANTLGVKVLAGLGPRVPGAP